MCLIDVDIYIDKFHPSYHLMFVYDSYYFMVRDYASLTECHIVFDECHKAKNLCTNGTCKSTKTGQTVLELQRRLPLARVVYASATGASEPKNMAYMVRLGLWGPGTPFARFADFLAAVEKRYLCVSSVCVARWNVYSN